MSGRFFDFEWAGFFLPSSWRADASVVPVVELCGTIGITKSFFQSALSLSGVEKVLEKAFSVRGAVSVAVVVNSPGGSPVQSHLIFKRIRALSIKKGLPVYVFCEDAAASGGYLIALAGDEIYAD
ncbi:MAG: S49 family peptidase, partial [Alphaproteobacteria bacterium]|nr:S49 family peptidase [Alphaproteobacteria bacterium]